MGGGTLGWVCVWGGGDSGVCGVGGIWGVGELYPGRTLVCLRVGHWLRSCGLLVRRWFGVCLWVTGSPGRTLIGICLLVGRWICVVCVLRGLCVNRTVGIL